MSDSADLYQKAILDHGCHPRNRRAIADCSHFAQSDNPSCGDDVAISLQIDQRDVIRDAAFDGRSCVLATASASLMTELLVGKTPAQAKRLWLRFHALATGGAAETLEGMESDTERLAALSGVRQYPARMRCATLAWQTMLAALETQRSEK
ncbi:MAG: SUF system NifU family Fe-S cluster assembly protein [Terracidiphilus sp.]